MHEPELQPSEDFWPTMLRCCPVVAIELVLVGLILFFLLSIIFFRIL